MITTVLLDDGGVMNDNSVRGPQWQRLIGEFMVPRFGGTIAEWGQANVDMVTKIMERIDQMYAITQEDLPENYYEDEHIMWTNTMFDKMGLSRPENPVEISIEASKWITPRVNSSYPGIVDSIHKLADSYDLYTASNELSFELEGYLTGMGVVQHFSAFFGPDILQAFKTSPLYYQRIVEHTGIKPEEAVIVDDKIKNLDYAREVGFQVIHSGLEGAPPEKYPYMKHASELPELIKSLI